MSSTTIYDASIGTYIPGLTALIHILKKASLQPDAETLPSARLIDDMQPLSYQIRTIAKTTNRLLTRLAAAPFTSDSDHSWENENENPTMQQLITLASKTLELLQTIDPKSLEGKEDIIVQLPMGNVTGKQFVFGFCVPSFFFHLQTVYAILRMKGVPLGKADYLDSFRVFVAPSLPGI